MTCTALNGLLNIQTQKHFPDHWIHFDFALLHGDETKVKLSS